MAILGCIADDFTGAADMASFLKKGGMRTLLLDGVPETALAADQADAIVIALKTRTQETEKAVHASQDALKWLSEEKCSHFYIKYCSTFDSTPKGNIGPVCDAAMEFLNVTCTLICPALPVNGRTVEQGNLYVNGVLLQNSSMKDHPLTPMRDSSLKRLMEAQSRYSCMEIGETYVCPDPEVDNGQQRCYLIPDCRKDEDAKKIAEIFGDMKLLTGGSGLAEPLARYLMRRQKKDDGTLHPLLLAGSCSVATRGQIAEFQKSGGKSVQITPAMLCDDRWNEMEFWEKIRIDLKSEPVLIYSSAPPDQVEHDRKLFGDVSAEIERVMAKLASLAVTAGVTGIVSAGGETSGAVTKALNQKAFWIGKSVAAGVPVMTPVENDRLHLILKSGNFGQEDFFEQALKILGERHIWKKH